MKMVMYRDGPRSGRPKTATKEDKTLDVLINVIF